ncbi:MAG: hypothetical protein DDT19_01761 [Syntrophomonadaceae bacterium]|nr:hypothetical protein [Bacillota bacterium]
MDKRRVALDDASVCEGCMWFGDGYCYFYRVAAWKVDGGTCANKALSGKARVEERKGGVSNG